MPETRTPLCAAVGTGKPIHRLDQSETACFALGTLETFFDLDVLEVVVLYIRFHVTYYTLGNDSVNAKFPQTA